MGDCEMEICIDESKLKELMKEAVFEALRDQKGLIYEIMTEVMEDVALAHAIREGESTETVGKEKILDIIEGRA